MFVNAIATVFIRNVNDGQFSWIHAFTLLTCIAIQQAIVSAREGRIEAHKKHVRIFSIGPLVIAGLTSFAPGRTMWHLAFEAPTGDAVVEVDHPTGAF